MLTTQEIVNERPGGFSEQEWKEGFRSMGDTEKSFVLGLWLGRLGGCPLDFGYTAGSLDPDKVWKVRCQAIALEEHKVPVYPGADVVGKATNEDLVTSADHFLAEVEGRWKDSQAGTELAHARSILDRVKRYIREF